MTRYQWISKGCILVYNCAGKGGRKRRRVNIFIGDAGIKGMKNTLLLRGTGKESKRKLGKK